MSQGLDAFEPLPREHEVFGYLIDKFGFRKQDFRPYRLWHRPGHASIWMSRTECLPCSEVKVHSVGILLFRKMPPRGFPTTAFILRFGHLAGRSVLDLSWDQALDLMLGKSIPDPGGSQGKGPYVLRTLGRGLGRGWIGQSELKLDVPKIWKAQLAQWLHR